VDKYLYVHSRVDVIRIAYISSAWKKGDSLSARGKRGGILRVCFDAPVCGVSPFELKSLKRDLFKRDSPPRAAPSVPPDYNPGSEARSAIQSAIRNVGPLAKMRTHEAAERQPRRLMADLSLIFLVADVRDTRVLIRVTSFEVNACFTHRA